MTHHRYFFPVPSHVCNGPLNKVHTKVLKKTDDLKVIIDVIENSTNKASPHLIIEDHGEQNCNILIICDMSCQRFSHCNRFHSSSEAKGVDPLLWCIFGIWMTAMLFPYLYERPEMETPIMRSLCIKPQSHSIPSFNATNSAPNTDVSTVA